MATQRRPPRSTKRRVIRAKPRVSPPAAPQLTANAISVLEKRYLWRDAEGALAETPAQLLARVARAIAEPEGRARAEWSERFNALMVARRFMPNSPTLMNAGRKGGQLSACFVLPLPDDLSAIFDTLKSAALIHQSGGGTGFGFSQLRQKGAIVRSSQGTASGPVSFLRIFDTATETIKQGGVRRGANMAVLRADHPDILEFIEAKRDQKSITNFNVSVGITHEFMRALDASREFELRDPADGKVVRRVAAREIFDRIARSAWECGDPGLVFLDRIAAFNPTPDVGEMESTNPCGEQPLLPYESCNLGSLNLGEYVKADKQIDWKLLREDIHVAVRFLDNVVDVNAYPIRECAKITLRNRKIGLGVMGFADLLLLLGVPYGAPGAALLGERVMSFVDREAKRASAELARKRGAFANFKGSMWDRLGYPKLRNATVSTVAPTGTISILAAASSGIEPLFSGVLHRNVLDGQRLTEVHPTVARLLASQGGAPADWAKWDDDKIGQAIGAAWAPAQSLSIEAHVRMQAVFQRHSDSAVSKTINLPESASVVDVMRAYRMAFAAGCKGITVYRDRSRPTQVLEHANPVVTPAAGPAACPDC